MFYFESIKCFICESKLLFLERKTKNYAIRNCYCYYLLAMTLLLDTCYDILYDDHILSCLFEFFFT